MRHQSRRFYLLTGLSTLVPGAGLIPTRLRAFGVLLTAVALGSGVGLVVWSGQQGLVNSVLDVAVRPGLLSLLIAVLLVGAVLWCIGILVTATVTRTGSTAGHRLRTAFVALCCIAVVVPSVVAARYVSIQRGLLDTVFASGPLGSAGGPGRRRGP